MLHPLAWEGLYFASFLSSEDLSSLRKEGGIGTLTANTAQQHAEVIVYHGGLL